MTAHHTQQERLGPVQWVRDRDGIVTVIFNDPRARTNMITDAHVDGMNSLLEDLEASRDQIRGVIVTSAKESFFSGPEFNAAEMPRSSGAPYSHLAEVRNQLRRLETLGRPVAAALTGSALGGGFEIALACHYRVGLNNENVRWALAERTMGIMPGGGGTVRAARMLGLATVVRETIGEGVAYHPAWALSRGLVDELAATPSEVEAAARRWVIAAGPHGGQQYWEQPGWNPPGGLPGDPEFDRELIELRSELNAVPTDGTLSARHEILDIALIALSGPTDDALEAETAAFRRLVALPTFTEAARTFGGMKRIRDRAEVGSLNPAAAGASARMKTFNLRNLNPLVDVFLPNSPKRVIEVALPPEATEADAATAVFAATPFGIPILVRPGAASVLHRLIVGQAIEDNWFADDLEAFIATQLLGDLRHIGDS